MGLLNLLANKKSKPAPPRPAVVQPTADLTPPRVEGRAERPQLDLKAELEIWPEAWLEWWQERAAILEYEAGLDRAGAEIEAFEQLLLTPPAVVFPVAWNQEWLLNRSELFQEAKFLRDRLKGLDHSYRKISRRVEVVLFSVPRSERAWVELAEELVPLLLFCRDPRRSQGKD